MIEVQVTHQRDSFKLDTQFISAGDVVALFGPSGAGKTTVINAIAGILQPDAGRIVVGDRVLFDSSAGIDVPVHQRRVGYVFQEPRLFPHLTVMQNLTYGQRSKPQHDIISLLGLEALLDRYPENLSGGEAQRVAIGRALFASPEILLMDEPLAALDMARKSEILPYLARVRDTQSVPIVYVSHAMSEVAQLATDLVLMQGGKTTRQGRLDDLLSDPSAVPDLGIQHAGAIITARLVQRNAGDGLCKLDTSQGEIFLPQLPHPEGALIRVRIQASDIILSETRPEGMSALNILPVTVSDIHEGQGPGAAVGLTSGADKLIARITRRSMGVMGLKPGLACFAIIKSVSIAPGDVAGNVTP